jgi:2-alkyl-3-oxoalkanoate reductase
MKVLVTGGGGFVGRHLIERLLRDGATVVSLGRQAQPKLKALGVEVIQGDLRSLEDVTRASKGCEVIHHTAAIAGVWGPAKIYEAINVGGTENILTACKKNRVPRLVFTSSPSVIFDGHSHLMADETKPYPQQWLCHYQRTKALAEQKVLAADGLQGLSTCSLRPHLIFGAGDPHLVPRLIERARRGRLRQVGAGKNLVDMVHVKNVVEAHVLAERALTQGRAKGQAYFITNGEPVELWTWVRELLQALKINFPQRAISENLAYGLGAGLEGFYALAKLKQEPPMTRFIARQLATSHTYNIEKAHRELAYSPVVSMQAGTREIIQEALYQT